MTNSAEEGQGGLGVVGEWMGFWNKSKIGLFVAETIR